MAGRRRSVPRSLRPVVGAAVLVATVRGVDVAWRRLTGRPTPVDARVVGSDEHAGEPAVVRDRLLYALLLGGALRLARLLGLPLEGRATRRAPTGGA